MEKYKLIPQKPPFGRNDSSEEKFRENIENDTKGNKVMDEDQKKQSEAREGDMQILDRVSLAMGTFQILFHDEKIQKDRELSHAVYRGMGMLRDIIREIEIRHSIRPEDYKEGEGYGYKEELIKE